MCGLFGIHSNQQRQDLTEMTVMALASMQHRGQEATGMAWAGQDIQFQRGRGLVNHVFNPIPRPEAHAVLGHVRYSTTGGAGFENENVQPLTARLKSYGLALAHNGNFSNSHELKNQLLEKGSILSTTSDTEIILHLLAADQFGDFSDALALALKNVRGAYNLIMLKDKEMWGVRDPWGFRCLFVGEAEGCTVLASEDTAIYNIGGKVLNELAPGEAVRVTEEGTKIWQLLPQQKKRLCSFEYIYFSRPDCVLEKKSVYHTRKMIGRQLAKNHHVEDADLVSGIPDSGMIMALGYAEESGLPHEMVISRNRYVGRSFIQPTEEMRKIAVRQKLAPARALIQGKSIVLIDDSLVRGTTTRQTVAMLKEAGARAVHLRIGAPPVEFSCYYGIDTPHRKELLASGRSVDEICRFVGADSLAYLSVEELEESVGDKELCLACFNGDYLEGDKK